MARVRHCLRMGDRQRILDEVARALAAGAVCAVPTESLYALVALPAATAPLRPDWPGAEPPTWLLRDHRDLDRFTATVPAAVDRLVARYWPGPLTVVVQDRSGAAARVRVPGHAFARELIGKVGQPLLAAGATASEAALLRDPEAIATAYGEALDQIVDDGPTTLGLPATVVAATDLALEVHDEGVLTAAEVLRTASELVLFVCTGNTCRSPLAEHLARAATGAALGIDPARVLAAGFWFASAGTSTLAGMPASDGSLAAAIELGLDLSSHHSQPVTAELVARASHIYCLGQSHRRALVAEFPAAADRISLLRPDGLDIGDPYGGDQRTYRRVRDEIRAAINVRLPEWLPPR